MKLSTRRMTQRPPYYSIALISAGSLAYEILLMRLFSIIQWHHFAYMIISLALLGYGISGSVTAIFREKMLAAYQPIYLGCIFLFGCSALFCFLAAQSIPFNAEEIFWDWRQVYYLSMQFLLLTIPFIFAATAICLTIMYYTGQVAQIYAMDLFGAGLGSLSIVLLLYYFFPLNALLIIACLGLATVLLAVWELKSSPRIIIVIATLLATGTSFLIERAHELKLSPYKSLPQTLQIDGARIIAQRSSPLGLLSVVANPRIPFRHAPGLSLMANREPPAQLGIFTDGDNMSVITQYPKNPAYLDYLDHSTSALPYHLAKIQRLLILGSGGGTDILQAKYHQIPHIDAVELNPQLIALVNETFKDFSGTLYQQQNIHLHISEAREFLTRNRQGFDLIQLALVDAFNASASGLYALNESYLYTIDALQLYLAHLEPGAYLSITRWIKMPPRDTLKLFATAVDALTRSGVKTPEKQLALIRNWQTSTLLIKNSSLTAQELAAIRTFTAARGFDVAYLPNIKAAEVNRYNKLRQPLFYQAAVALLSEQREEFIEQYKYNLQPARDDRPYFHHFFKWSSIAEILSLRGQGGMPLLGWGYILFVTTLLIASFMSVVMILLPIRFYRPKQKNTSHAIRRRHIFGYFFAIGLAFLFIEIAFIQKFILFLHHPLYAVAVTLTAFLVFAGLGSNWCGKFTKPRVQRRVIRFSVFGIALLCLLFLISMQPLFNLFATLSMAVKVLLSILLIAPLAFLMGIPFPLAMSSVAVNAPRFIPWAWGINGCASVISAVLATLLAIHFGFRVVILLAVSLYISAAFIFPQARSTKSSVKT